MEHVLKTSPDERNSATPSSCFGTQLLKGDKLLTLALTVLPATLLRELMQLLGSVILCLQSLPEACYLE